MTAPITTTGRSGFWKTIRLAVCVAALSFGNASANTVCFSDSFETGNLDKWGGNKDHVTIVPRPALDGQYWISVLGSGSEDAISMRNLIPSTNEAVVTTFIFTSNEPTGNDRSLNALWRQTPGDFYSPQINLRVGNYGGTDHIGDVQVAETVDGDGDYWRTILTDVVEFGGPTNSLGLQINGFGSGFNYDVTINGHTTNGVTYSQNGTPTNGVVEFLLSDRDERYAVDNIVIESGSLSAFTDSFEAGNFDKWTLEDPNDFTIVSNTAALDGTYSAKVVGDGSGADEMQATFTSLTDGPVVTTFLFTTEATSGRNLQAFWRMNPGGFPQIWLRVINGSSGYGSVQVVDDTSISTILTDAVDYSATNSLTLTINGFGAGEFNYDVTVNGYTASGLTACQQSGGGNPPLERLAEIAFANYNAPVTLDNIRVTQQGHFVDDFETGNLDKWEGVTSNFKIEDRGVALDGDYSASFSGSGFVGTTDAALNPSVSNRVVSTSFIFTTDEPTGDRSLNAYWREQSNTPAGPQINLRIGNYGGTSHIGDVQIVNGSAFQTILTDVVSFSEVNSMELQINRFGSGFNYDVTVNGHTASGVTYSQSGTPTGLKEFAFADRDGEYTVDNILIEIVNRGTLIIIQ